MNHGDMRRFVRSDALLSGPLLDDQEQRDLERRKKEFLNCAVSPTPGVYSDMHIYV